MLSGLRLGISYSNLIGMPYGQLVALIKTSNQLSADNGTDSDGGVRDATPEEIAHWI